MRKKKVKTHGCCRCGRHHTDVKVYVKKTGAKFTMCDRCAESEGRK